MSDEPLILIADDEPEILELVRKALIKAGFRTIEAYDGKKALELYREKSPDLLVLDINMPEMDGDDVCRAIRQENELVPIFFLTSNAAEGDRLLGFEIGADDYIPKPFSQKELVYRIRAHLKRTLTSSRIEDRSISSEPQRDDDLPDDSITYNNLSLSVEKNRVYWGKQEYKLTKTQFAILKLLMERPGKFYQNDTITQVCFDGSATDAVIRQHISGIRKALNRFDEDFIVNELGAGYRLGSCKMGEIVE